MMNRRTFGRSVLGLLAGGGAMALSGCGVFGGDSYRQKITVEVNTPAGLRTGHSVVETSAKEISSWGGNGPGISFGLKGEAVAVDLGNGRTLFALLRGAEGSQGDAAAYQARLIGDAIRGGGAASAAIDVQDQSVMQVRAQVDEGLRVELPRGQYPMLVMFGDLGDPTSVERVEPSNMAATFGPGVTLKRITVEVTDEPVTTGIEARLPKPSEKGFFNWDGRSNPNEGGIFGIWDFVRGASK